MSEQSIPKLAKDGSLPVAVTATASAGLDIEGAKAKYKQICASCHGDAGKGDGAASSAFTPRPRNFADKDWQAKVDDKHIHLVIDKGGQAAGLSAGMPPWGTTLKSAEIDAMVQVVREFGK